MRSASVVELRLRIDWGEVLDVERGDGELTGHRRHLRPHA